MLIGGSSKTEQLYICWWGGFSMLDCAAQAGWDGLAS